MRILDLYTILCRVWAFLLSHSEPNKKLLRQIIIKDCPELEFQCITDYEKVCILRHWAARIINCSTYSLLFDIQQPDFYSLSAYEMYKSFTSNIGGVWCGGANNFLKKIYGLFGFKTYNLNYGTPDAFTHVSTLVMVEHDNQKIMSVQDAYFDITYEYTNNEPMDYFTMLKLLMERRDNEIFSAEPQPPLMRNFYKYSGDTWMNLGCCTNIEEIKNDSPKADRITHARCPFTPDFALATFLDKINKYLIDNGLPLGLIYLNLFPNSVSNDLSGIILATARQITGWPPVVSHQRKHQGERLK